MKIVNKIEFSNLILDIQSFMGISLMVLLTWIGGCRRFARSFSTRFAFTLTSFNFGISSNELHITLCYVIKIRRSVENLAQM